MNSQSNNSLSVLMCVYDKDNIKHFSYALNSLVIQSDYIDELIILDIMFCLWTSSYASKL